MHPYDDRAGRLADAPLYRAANRAIWALAPILLIALLLSIPSIRATQQRAQAELSRRTAAENLRYCEKWGMPAGTPANAACVRDLVNIRAQTELRVRDEAAADF